MTDWSNPTLAQTWANRDLAIKGRDESNAKMNYDADSNIPDDTIRWNPSTNRFEIWDTTGSSWSALSSSYAISVTQLNGQNAAYYNDTPNGTRSIFYQSSPPTGWTQDTTVNDRVLRVVNSTGGGSGGSWTISGISVNGHTLTVAEMPSHDHGNTGSGGSHTHSGSTNTTGSHTHTYTELRDGGGGPFQVQGDDNDRHVETRNTGSAGSHSHTVSINSAGSHTHDIPHQGGGGSHTHGLTIGSAWRPSYIDVIVATRSK